MTQSVSAIMTWVTLTKKSRWKMKRGKGRNQFQWVFPAWVSLREQTEGSESGSQIVLVLIFTRLKRIWKSFSCVWKSPKFSGLSALSEEKILLLEELSKSFHEYPKASLNWDSLLNFYESRHKNLIFWKFNVRWISHISLAEWLHIVCIHMYEYAHCELVFQRHRLHN